MADSLSSCGNDMKSEDTDGKDEVPFDQDSCMKNKIKLNIEELSNSMGTGIDKSTPHQEGFIPPPCFEYAKTILDAVHNDSLNGNKNNTYNSSAILLNNLLGTMRDKQELSKFLVTSKDNSTGSKELRINTMNNKKYAQIYGNKDVKDFGKYTFGVEI